MIGSARQRRSAIRACRRTRASEVWRLRRCGCRLLTEPFCPENGAGEKRAGNALQLLFYLGENRRRANPERLKRTRIRAHVFLQVEDVRPDKLFLNVGIMLQMFFNFFSDFQFFETFSDVLFFCFSAFSRCYFSLPNRFHILPGFVAGASDSVLSERKVYGAKNYDGIAAHRGIALEVPPRQHKL